MNTEKIIKKQSLNLLSKDNWGNTIAGFFIICIPAILILLLNELFYEILRLAVSVDTSSIFFQSISSVVSMVTVIALLFSTPIITGYLRMCYLICKNEKYHLNDIFYYFKKEKYSKALSLNLNIIVRILGYFIIFNIPNLIFSGFFAITSSVALYAVSIFFTVFGIIATIIASIKYTVIPCVYFEDESISNNDIIKLGIKFVEDKKSDCRKILFSFIPLILLCFFIVPLIFVVPYITVAFMNNGKWITSIYLQK